MGQIFFVAYDLFPLVSDSVVSISFSSAVGLLCQEEWLNIEKVISMLGKNLKWYVDFPAIVLGVLFACFRFCFGFFYIQLETLRYCCW